MVEVPSEHLEPERAHVGGLAVADQATIHTDMATNLT
jgi:hypothetical protein